jgi:hypothetical protein
VHEELVRMVAVANKDASQNKRRPFRCTLDDRARLFGSSRRSCRQCGYALTVSRTEPVLVLTRRTQTGRARLGSSSEILRAVLPLYLFLCITINYKKVSFVVADVHTHIKNGLPPLSFKIRSCETSLIKRRYKWDSTGSQNINFTEQTLSKTFLGFLCSVFTTRSPIYTSFMLQETTTSKETMFKNSHVNF